MDPFALPLAVLAVLPAFAFSAWVWLAMALADEELEELREIESLARIAQSRFGR